MNFSCWPCPWSPTERCVWGGKKRGWNLLDDPEYYCRYLGQWLDDMNECPIKKVKKTINMAKKGVYDES